MRKLWIEDLASCTAGEARVLAERITAASIARTSSSEAEQAVPGVLLFSDVERALAFLEERQVSPLERVLAVAASDVELSARDSWRLLQGGATDVVRWTRTGSPVDDILARLQRWHEIDEVLAQPLMRENVIGQSPAWIRVVRQIVEVAVFTEASILILGESGTGKELAARLIHTLDRREAKGELVVLDCTTVSPELAGSEFFGHERGAFTGAVAAREGAFALADGGTLFLDEIGELPVTMQAQLLRAIQERMYKPVGSNVWHRARFRLVCATNRDLTEEVRTGAFRRDLYHRITSWVFRLPPLRERPQDILPLAQHFAAQLRPRQPALALDETVQELLLRREYPGNVRDLKQLVSRIVERHVGQGPVTVGSVPVDDRPADVTDSDWCDHRFELSIRRALAQGVGLKAIGRAASDVAVRLVVEQENGNLQKAARKLGVTDRALQLRRKDSTV